MTHTDTWKSLERTAAKKLGGTRIVRGNNFSESLLDVEHPWLSIDAKWRQAIAVVTWYRKLCKDSDKIYGKGKKVPVLILKEKGMRGELIVIDIEDFISVVNNVNFKIEQKENEDG